MAGFKKLGTHPSTLLCLVIDRNITETLKALRFHRLSNHKQ